MRLEVNVLEYFDVAINFKDPTLVYWDVFEVYSPKFGGGEG